MTQTHTRALAHFIYFYQPLYKLQTHTDTRKVSTIWTDMERTVCCYLFYASNQYLHRQIEPEFKLAIFYTILTLILHRKKPVHLMLRSRIDLILMCPVVIGSERGSWFYHYIMLSLHSAWFYSQ